MTAPIVLQNQGIGADIQQGLAPLLQALQFRQQIGLQQQQLDIQRQKAQADIEQSGAATAESRGRLKKMMEDMEQQRLDLQSKDLATTSFIEALSAPGGLTPENINAMRTKIVKQGDKKISSGAMIAFDGMLKQEEEFRRLSAQRRQEETQAGVDEATAEAEIEAGKLAGQVAEAELRRTTAQAEGVEVDTRLEELRLSRDPQRVETARRLWEMGLPWGQAREGAGLAAGGPADDAMFAGKAGELSEKAMAAKNFALQMVPANAVVNSLTRGGTRVEVTTGLQRAAQSNTLGIAINEVQDAKQQQILQAGLQYVMAYRFFMSGQQSSDREYLNMIKVTLESPGDTEEVIRQKRVMRQMQISAVIKTAEGTVDPVEVLDETIQQMRLENMDGQFIDAMTHERNLAVRNQNRQRLGVADSVQASRGGVEPRSVIQFGDSVLRALFDTTGRR